MSLLNDNYNRYKNNLAKFKQGNRSFENIETFKRYTRTLHFSNANKNKIVLNKLNRNINNIRNKTTVLNNSSFYINVEKDIVIPKIKSKGFKGKWLVCSASVLLKTSLPRFKLSRSEIEVAKIFQRILCNKQRFSSISNRNANDLFNGLIGIISLGVLEYNGSKMNNNYKNALNDLKNMTNQEKIVFINSFFELVYQILTHNGHVIELLFKTIIHVKDLLCLINVDKISTLIQMALRTYDIRIDKRIITNSIMILNDYEIKCYKR